MEHQSLTFERVNTSHGDIITIGNPRLIWEGVSALPAGLYEVKIIELDMGFKTQMNRYLHKLIRICQKRWLEGGQSLDDHEAKYWFKRKLKFYSVSHGEKIVKSFADLNYRELWHLIEFQVQDYWISEWGEPLPDPEEYKRLKLLAIKKGTQHGNED